MTTVMVNGRKYDIDLIIFDKDGTLIDLHQLWGKQIEKWGNQLQEQLALDQEDIVQLYHQLGYDFQQKKLLPDTPAAVASGEQFMTIASFLLYQNGVSWTAAEQAVGYAAAHTFSSSHTLELLHLIGDVNSTFIRLRQAGIELAIATSDGRASTEQTIAHFGWQHQLAATVCADDGLPKKPAPDAIYAICDQTNIPATRALMVGDSTGDIACGRAAGVAGCIGVGDGGITAVADTVIQSIAEIKIGAET